VGEQRLGARGRSGARGEAPRKGGGVIYLALIPSLSKGQRLHFDKLNVGAL
jgi:hypothetical protein